MIVKTESLEPYRPAGYDLIPLHQWDYVDARGRDRGKSPLHNDWPRHPRCGEDEIRAHVSNGYNIGVRLRAIDFIVDYDPRNDEDGSGWDAFVMEVGQEWIDSCPRVNTGGGGVHLYATKPPDLLVRERHEAFGRGVEFKTKGRQVVAAGSKHPSEKYYEWDDFSPPLDRVPPVDEVLLSLVGRPGVGVPSTEPGQIDNDQLARLLSSLDPEAFAEHERWLELGMAAYHATNGQGLEAFVDWSMEDPEYQGHDEIVTERWHSWAADAGGSAVTMATLLMRVREAKGDTNWLGLDALPEPEDDPDADFEPPALPDGIAPGPAGALDILSQRYAVVPEGKDAFVYETLPGEIPRRFRVDAFKNIIGNQYTENDEGNRIKIAPVWLGSERRRTYAGVEFAPEGGREGWLNTWTGWGVEPADGKWDLIRELIYEVLADGDAASAEYILDWSAHMLAHPGTPAEVALVFRGPKGCGKTTFGEILGMIAGNHGRTVSQGLGEKFNAHLREAVYLFADEAFWAGDRNVESTLKTMITSRELAYQPKGVDISMAQNCLHIIMCANDEWIVAASDDERRYGVFEIRASRDRAWWDAVYKQIEGDGVAAFMKHLLERDLTGFHPRNYVPATSALIDQQMASMAGVKRFIFDIIQSGDIPGAELPDDEDGAAPDWETGPVTVSRKALRQALRGTLGRGPGTDRQVSTSLGKALKEWIPNGPGMSWRGKERLYVIPSRPECKAHFEWKFKGKIPWDD